MRLLFFLLILTFAAARAAVPTSETAIVGRFAKGPVDVPIVVNAAEFNQLFEAGDSTAFPAEIQAQQFFRNGGGNLAVVRVNPDLPLNQALPGTISPPHLSGIGALLSLSNLGILICPEITTLGNTAMQQCLARIGTLRENAPVFVLLDPPSSITTVPQMIAWRQANLPTDLAHAATYFPHLSVDPANWAGGSSAVRITTGASGTMAAAIRKNDQNRAIWKAPAGPDITLETEGLKLDLTAEELSLLNIAGINALRDSPSSGPIAWGARTLDESYENRYIATVRTRHWIYCSLQRELSDAALQENEPALWSNLQTRAELFLQALYVSGAFQGTPASKAYYANCNSSTTTTAEILNHRVNVEVGFALMRPEEFSPETITLATLDPLRATPDVQLIVSPPLSGKCILSYPTTPGFDHNLQSSGTMSPGSWLNFGPVLGDGTWQQIIVPASDPKRFFRVRTSPAW